MRPVNTEFPQTEPHEPQQATRVLGFDVARVFKDIKTASLNTLGMAAPNLPTDVVSKVLDIQGEESEVNNNVVLDEGLVAALQSRILELKTENEVLAREKNEYIQLLKESREDHFSLRIALDGKDKTLSQYEKRIHTLEDELDRMQQKELALHKIILDKAGSEKVSDQTMVSKFIILRQKIQHIARLHHYHMDQSPSKKIEDGNMAEFFEEKTWGCLNTGDRINRVRSKIFRFIHANFLNFPLFGLEGCKSKDTSYDDKDIRVDSGLRVFEKLLNESQVSAGLVSDWTVLTIDCIDKLDYRSSFVRNVSDCIYHFFSPLLANETSLQNQDEIRNKITELCNEAMDLGMLMRRSGGLYKVKVPGKGGLPLSASACGERLVQPFGVEGGKNSEAGDKVSHTIFGALIKQPEHGHGRQLVLEPAHVILKKETRSLHA